MDQSIDATGIRTGANEASDARIGGFAAAVVVAAMHIVPRGSWLYLILFSLTLLWLLWRQGWRLNEAQRPTATGLVLLGFGGLALAGTLWAAVPLMAVRSGLATMAQVALAIVAADASARLSLPTLRRIAEGVLVGFAIGLAFLIVEGVSNFALHRAFYNAFPRLMPSDDQDFLFDHGKIVGLRSYMLKRNMVASALLLWPVLMMIPRFVGAASRSLIPYINMAVVVSVALAARLSSHDSSMLAMALGGAALVWAGYAFRPAWTTITAVWVALNLLVVPAMLLEFHAGLYNANWLQFSARHRLVIWGYSAEQVLKAPIFGIGAGSGGVLDARRTDIITLPGTPFPLNTANHQHDIFLQTWYEMGALGALVLCAAGLVGLWRIRRLPEDLGKWSLAVFASTVGMVSTSYGLWQEWFQASIALSVVALVIAMRLSQPGAIAPPEQS